MRGKDELKRTWSNSTPWLHVFEHSAKTVWRVVATPPLPFGELGLSYLLQTTFYMLASQPSSTHLDSCNCRSHKMQYNCGYCTANWCSCKSMLLPNAVAAEYPQCTLTATPNWRSHSMRPTELLRGIWMCSCQSLIKQGWRTFFMKELYLMPDPGFSLWWT